jgi:uncharacterized protein YdaU (DUF1376 family)
MPKRKLPWFKMYPNDFLNGIGDLSSAHEIALYTVILHRIYDNSGPIKDDIRALAARSKMRVDHCERALNRLIELEKIQIEDGKIINERARKDLKQCLLETQNENPNRQKSQQNQESRVPISEVRSQKSETNNIIPIEDGPRKAFARLSQTWMPSPEARAYAMDKLGEDEDSFRELLTQYIRHYSPRYERREDWNPGFQNWADRAGKSVRPKLRFDHIDDMRIPGGVNEPKEEKS